MSLFYGALLLSNYFEQRQNIITPIKEAVREKTKGFADHIDRRLSRAHPLASLAAKKLQTLPLKEEKIRTLLRRILQAQPDLVGAGLAFAPFRYDRDVRLFAPYETRRDDELTSLQIEDHYDYTLDDSDWYQHAFTGPGGWQKPRFSLAATQKVVEYALPFFRTDPDSGEKIKQGIIFLHYPFEPIVEELKALNLGKSGYSVLFSKERFVLVHPDNNLLEANATIKEISEKISPQIQDFEGISDVTGQAVWINAQQIPSIQWIVASYHEIAEFTQGQTVLRQMLMQMIICIILLVLSLVIMDLSRKQRHSTSTLWVRGLTISAIFLIGISVIWFLGREDDTWKDPQKNVIIDHADIEAFKTNHVKEALINRTPLPIFIPTGVFVQSIEFTSANNVSLTGYIWQHYQHHVPSELERGFIFPEAESSTITKAYEKETSSGKSVGWYFQITLRQSFDYSHYPFDRQSVWIRLWHKDFKKNAVLLPDLSAYDKLHPERLPGIEQDFVLPGWKVSSSFFNYRFNRYNTDFGIGRPAGQHTYPELYFEIGIKRQFLNPFISNLTPIIVVLLMLFAVLVTTTKDSEKIQFLGFNTSAIIGTSSALFFVVLVSHIDVRGSLSASKIFYLEYFYVVAYGTILAITVNSILFSWAVKIRFVQYRDNLLPKLFYWPVITCLMFVVTVITFY